MIGLNEELALREKTGNPVKIGLIGAGQMGIDVVAAVKMMKGIDVVITVDIDANRAQSAYEIGEVTGEVVFSASAAEADTAVAAGKRVYTNDYRIVARMKQIDVMLEATGVPEIGAKAALLSRTGSEFTK